MKVQLKAWDDQTFDVEVPEGTTEIAGVFVSGDEVLVYPVFIDPMEDERIEDYLEGGFHCKLIDGKWVEIYEDTNNE